MARPSHDTLALRDARAYIFRVLLNGKPRNFDDIEGMENGEFILPKNPISVQYQAGSRSFIYASGITEMQADQQGVDPPVIVIGVDSGERAGYDAASRRGLDGRAYMRSLEDLIRSYLKAAAEQGRGRLPIHVLEFHDIYRGESWIVTPQGVPYGSEDASRPYSESGSIRLQALKPAQNAPTPIDPIGAALRELHAACPLNPACKYGGPFVQGCPYNRSGS